MSELSTISIQANVDNIRQRIQSTCKRCSRNPEDVTILAAVKKRTPEQVVDVIDAGITVLGENRVQEAVQKIPLCPDSAQWHFIGHLQTNKVRAAVEMFDFIHSIDSLKLMEAVNKASSEAGKIMKVCIEVNVSGEASKHGVAPGEVCEILELCNSLHNVNLAGLMTMPPFSPDAEDSREYYSELVMMRDQWRDDYGYDLSELSFGMSNDFEVAIEEGATWIRLGSVLFTERGE